MKKKSLFILLAMCGLLISCGPKQGGSTTPSNSDTGQSEVSELDRAKGDAEALINSINLDNYIGEEKTELQKLIAGLTNLINSSTSAEEIYAAIKSINEYIAFAKTKAQHEAEEEADRQRALAAEKERLLKLVGVERPNRFRKEELDALKAAGDSLKDSIQAATTMEELNAVSFAEFNNLLNNSKTNAQYTMEEWFNYPLTSKWALVNEHTANWLCEDATFKTKGLGGDDVGYMISSGTYSGDLSFVLRSHNTVNASQNFGFLIGNMDQVGTGFDGYLVNYDYATDHQYLQVWYFDNANAMEAANVYQYIGGWVYNNQFSTTLTQDDIRVIYDGEYISLMNNNEYLQKGDLAYTITVDLKLNGSYAVDPNGTYSIGFFNWDGTNLASPRTLELKEFITEETIVGTERAAFYAEQTISAVDLSNYASNELNAINAEITSFKELITTGTYAQIMNHIPEFQTFIASQKTKGQVAAAAIFDNIYSNDPTKYTASNWDLVNEHGLGWAHTAGTNTVVTTGLDGYCMDAEIHTNYTMVFKVTGTQAVNPYNAAWPGSAIIIGGSVDSTTGNYFKGIYICLSQSWGFQIYNAMAGANQDLGCYGDQFLGGFDCGSAEGKVFRITVSNSFLTVHLINTATGAETRMSGVTGSFANADAWGNIPSGHIGILDWDQTASTYEILEYRDL